jgi:adenylate cyclase
MNDLAAERRWERQVRGLSAVMILPLVAHDRCSGVLVLGSSDADSEFSAGDLKQASTLGFVAAAVLHNAQLFEEVVEIKNFNENILENLSNGVITLDLSLNISKTNAAARRILRLGDRQLRGAPISDIFKGENAWIPDMLSIGKAGTKEELWVEKDIHLDKGQRVTVNLSAVPLTNVERKHIGFMLVLEDITREKRIRSTMARFMSERVVEKLLNTGESMLGGAAQDVTILFSDIRNFTGLSETLSARQMVGTLNDYFTEMVEVIFTARHSPRRRIRITPSAQQSR